MTTKNSSKSLKNVEIDPKELKSLYCDKHYSWAEIAKIYQTYPNAVRRQGLKLGIVSRTKSEAQVEALATGRHTHPTKGKQRSEDERIKISEGMATVWENLTDKEKKSRSKQAQKQWNNMTQDEKANLQHAAAVAIRKAAKEGSKLEKFLYTELNKLGYRVDFHKEHLIANENLHLDLFLPKIGVAIEVDGPSHFEPIWGTETLQRNQKADSEKSGLVLGKGLVFIRIKHVKSLSAKYQRDILSKLIDKLVEIEKKFPSRNNRYIVLGD
jgi:hypothetical protein